MHNSNCNIRDGIDRNLKAKLELFTVFNDFDDHKSSKVAYLLEPRGRRRMSQRQQVTDLAEDVNRRLGRAINTPKPYETECGE